MRLVLTSEGMEGTNLGFLVFLSVIVSPCLTQVLLAAGFAFDIVDRIGGTTLNIGPPQWCTEWLIEPLLMPQGVW